MPRIQLPAAEGTNFENALSLVPNVKKMYDQLYEDLWSSMLLTKETKEKVRVYLANVNGCATCMSLSYVDDYTLNEQIQSAIQSGDFTSLSAFDQSLFSFIHTYRTAPRKVTDQEIESLTGTWSNEQIMELLAVINLFDGFHKIIVSLDLYDFCSLR
ncbi:hypothetical protein [Priestia koreensis]|uniref:hypothetical protein n=1 Tax=Priestia koreensis TaxID=284581 RepID=UPI001F5AA430|nr:hypothetical protein [Priestia koreensis]MCM3004272.1 hypothetical protein [Priestia koreensis]UNL83484.1 hypothetical protein IE339_15080 [Priestia koreensis]